jgi:hypothetical protein
LPRAQAQPCQATQEGAGRERENRQGTVSSLLFSIGRNVWCSVILGAVFKTLRTASATIKGGHAHDPQGAMPHARIWDDGRIELRKPVVPLRRLILPMQQSRRCLTSLVRLSYLAPDIVNSILEGRRPIELSSSRLLRLNKDLPVDFQQELTRVFH